MKAKGVECMTKFRLSEIPLKIEFWHSMWMTKGLHEKSAAYMFTRRRKWEERRRKKKKKHPVMGHGCHKQPEPSNQDKKRRINSHGIPADAVNKYFGDGIFSRAKRASNWLVKTLRFRIDVSQVVDFILGAKCFQRTEFLSLWYKILYCISP